MCFYLDATYTYTYTKATDIIIKTVLPPAYHLKNNNSAE